MTKPIAGFDCLCNCSKKSRSKTMSWGICRYHGSAKATAKVSNTLLKESTAKQKLYFCLLSKSIERIVKISKHDNIMYKFWTFRTYLLVRAVEFENLPPVAYHVHPFFRIELLFFRFRISNNKSSNDKKNSVRISGETKGFEQAKNASFCVPKTKPKLNQMEKKNVLKR